MSTNTLPLKKPAPLRIAFILNLLMCVLPFVFYYVFTVKEIRVGGLDPIYMAYTGLAYIASFAFLVWSILKRKIWFFRGVLFLNILIAIPVGAYIGIVFALVSLLLSLNQKVLQYFTEKSH